MTDRPIPDETVAVAQLRAFVERIERIEADIKELNGDKSEVYKELRGCGFDVKAVRQVVAKRKLDSVEREERDAMFNLYWEALTGVSRVHVHEGQSYAAQKGRGERSSEIIENQESPSGKASGDGHTGEARNLANKENGHVDRSAERAIEEQVDQKNSLDGLTSLAAREGDKPLHSNSAQDGGGTAASPFINPRCQQPATCHRVNTKDDCFECSLAWSKRPRDEQRALWQEALDRSEVVA